MDTNPQPIFPFLLGRIMKETVYVNWAKKMCKLNIQTNIYGFPPGGHVCCLHSLCPQHTQRNPMIERGMGNKGRMAHLMKDKNEQIALPSYLSGFAIHPCSPPLWQVTVPLSLFSVKLFKAPC